MRTALVIVVLTFTLGLASRPIHGQTPAVDTPPPESIDMLDTQSGWARLLDYRSGVSMLLRTTSGGTHWEDVTPIDSSGHRIDVAYFHAFNSRIAWVMKAPLAATTEIFRTTDGGRTWKSAAIPASSVTSITFINASEGWLIAFLAAATGANESADIYRSTDGGKIWIRVAWSAGLPYGVKRGITFLNSATGWITVLDPRGNRPYLYLTRDGGSTWQPQKMRLPRELTPRWEAQPEPPKFFSARDGSIPVRYDILNGSGERTGSVIVLYATHDGGTTWMYTAPLQVNTLEAVHLAAADVNHAWILNGDVLHTTTDGGHLWMPIPSNLLFAGDVKQLDFISPQIGWAIGRTFPFLVKTVDGGRTWAPVTYAITR
jgi:photosystem II stability/assembly factor-like uncharacterized protein